MAYYVIYFSEDGISIEVKEKKEVEQLIKDLSQDYPHGIPVLDTVAKRYDMNNGSYPVGKYLIIEGTKVVPQVVSVIKEYKI